MTDYDAAGAAVSEALSRKPGANVKVTDVYSAVQAVMEEVGYVQKGGVNSYQGYKYVTEADAIQACRSAMLKHNLLLLPTIVPDAFHVPSKEDFNTHIIMRFEVRHVPSASSFLMDIPASGSDVTKHGPGDKGVYKAITGATKYAILKLFMLPTGEDPEVAREDEAPNASGYVQAPFAAVVARAEKIGVGLTQTDPVPVMVVRDPMIKDQGKATRDFINEFIGDMADDGALGTFFRLNQDQIDGLKASDKKAYDAVIALFSTRRAQLKGA